MSNTVEKQPNPASKGDGAAGDGQDMIPKARLDEAIQKRQEAEERARTTSERLARLEGELSALKETSNKPAAEKPVYTRAQLSALVEKGQLSKAEMENILDKQSEEAIEQRVSERVESTLEKQRREQKISSEIDAYTVKVPDLKDKSSETYLKVQSEFEYLVERLDEDPQDLRTELKAIRSVLGDLDKIATERKPKKQTHQDSLGGSGADDVEDANGAPKDIPARNRKYYEMQINKGLYKGWDDPLLKAELARLRKRAA